MGFLFHQNTKIQNPYPVPAIVNAVDILKRDMGKRLVPAPGLENAIILQKEDSLPPESYQIQTEQAARLTIKAADPLGFVYGLLSISRDYLNVQPFWFWMDQQLEPLGTVEIPFQTVSSPTPAVRFRGWFLNDEVLMIRWNNGKAADFPWKMAFEALLRCGGNMVIPGTDKSSRANAKLAADYGLWLTHHHAEPLGAEIFARAYPDLLPSYSQNPECFHHLWEEAVIRQKDWNTVWTLGFRGQGDCPFWESKGEEDFDTPQKRGRLISELIEFQRQIVCRYVEHPIFCTNLYGEIMELYASGHIALHPDIIKIWADNGYGKMCSRRQDNHCTRTPALPSPSDPGPHGVYYHVSFHDLQAAGHITTLPNSIDFVNQELQEGFRLGIRDYWIINSSNIRPHVYHLDAIRKLWFGQTVSDASHSREFAQDYFGGHPAAALCLENYAGSRLAYGPEEDQHAGEQFYNYCVRLLARQFIMDKTRFCVPLLWLTGECPPLEQIRKVLTINQEGEGRLRAYRHQCLDASASFTGPSKQLFDSTILLQAEIHFHCNQGAIFFCRGLLQFHQSAYKESFYLLGQASEEFETANRIMRQSEYGVWTGFYENDCLTDIKFTAYVIRSVMRMVRVIGDDQRFAEWYEDFVRPREDRKVRLLSITENHMTDAALFEAMKRAGFSAEDQPQ